MIGRVLSHYEILEQIGAGGMGVVYRARDCSLGREVALKILPAEFAGDPERVSRFRREAEALAALDHPNIVTIFAIEEADGLRFLTMQLVHGRSLDSLIPSGGMPLERALRVGAGIAEALGAAHERGLVHRDLKPGNVMVTDDGHVKVLDFGLAKLRTGIGDGADASRVSTEQVTVEGVILGTTAYMSPEQAEGRAADHRSDIFSLGVVLYEMVTGGRPFRGDTLVALISSILKDAPRRVTELNPSLPKGIERVISRALAKDRSRRYQSVLDLRSDLEELPSDGDTAVRPAALPRRPKAWVRHLLVATGVVAVGTGAWLLLSSGLLRPRPARLGATFAQLTALPGVEQFPSLSPDGEWVSYSGAGPGGDLDIYLQSCSGRTAIDLTRDSEADDDQPAFSPDGQRIAFRSSRDGGGIFVMGRTGEAVRRVTRGGFGPAWSPDGNHLVYADEYVGLLPLNWEGRSELWVVPASGGEPRSLGTGDGVQPHWSPHGQRIAYQTRLGTKTQMDIMTISADGGDPRAVVSDVATDWGPAWSPDGRFIYFVSDRGGSMNLWRIAVDEESGEARGEPEPLTTPASFVGQPSLSGDGRRIAFSSVVMRQNIQIATFDPVSFAVADPRWLTSGSRQWSSPDLSPDGAWAAFYSRDLPEGDLYVVRTDATGLRQVTGDPAVDRVPRWSPDGRRLAYFASRPGEPVSVWVVGADGSEKRRLAEGAVVAWSPDGTQLSMQELSEQGAHTGWSVVTVATGERKEMPEPESSLQPFVGNSWSPDGRRIAGMISYSDQGIVTLDIASRTFARLTSFGQWPVWLPDSRHLLFVTGGSAFHVVDAETREVRKVFSVSRDVLGPPRLSSDGRQVVYSRRSTEADIWLLTFQ